MFFSCKDSLKEKSHSCKSFIFKGVPAAVFNLILESANLKLFEVIRLQLFQAQTVVWDALSGTLKYFFQVFALPLTSGVIMTEPFTISGSSSFCAKQGLQCFHILYRSFATAALKTKGRLNIRVVGYRRVQKQFGYLHSQFISNTTVFIFSPQYFNVIFDFQLSTMLF